MFEWTIGCLAAFAAGFLLGKGTERRRIWQLRKRSDQQTWAAELFLRLAEDPALLESAVRLVPEETFAFTGKSAYCRRLHNLLASERSVPREQAGAEIFLFPPEETPPAGALPRYWLGDLMDRAQEESE